jgi:DNA polymerase III subunit delta'
MTAAGLYTDVVGQERAVAQLRAAAERPVHAYMFVGPPGIGKRSAARSFAASLLCNFGGCGVCDDCRLALAERHPDLVVVERVGPYITVEQAGEITRLAARTPVQSARKVLLLVDFHLVQRSGPALLKTIEEPPAGTHFIILADHVPPELVTIASRSVQIEFGPLAVERIAEALQAEGTDPQLAAELAAASGGRLDRARLLATDPGFAARRAAWQGVPSRLDGTGATVGAVVGELVKGLDDSVAPLVQRQTAEMAELEERLRSTGERGSLRKEMEDRHKRELRRLRTDELRSGLVALSAVYRDRLVSEQGGTRLLRSCVEATEAIAALNKELVRNPNETLQLQALLLTLSRRGG